VLIAEVSISVQVVVSILSLYEVTVVVKAEEPVMLEVSVRMAA